MLLDYSDGKFERFYVIGDELWSDTYMWNHGPQIRLLSQMTHGVLSGEIIHAAPYLDGLVFKDKPIISRYCDFFLYGGIDVIRDMVSGMSLNKWRICYHEDQGTWRFTTQEPDILCPPLPEHPCVVQMRNGETGYWYGEYSQNIRLTKLSPSLKWDEGEIVNKMDDNLMGMTCLSSGVTCAPPVKLLSDPVPEFFISDTHLHAAKITPEMIQTVISNFDHKM